MEIFKIYLNILNRIIGEIMLEGGYDIVSMLEGRGLSRNDAIYINSVIEREQIPYLVNSLLSENTESEDELRGILYEYGIDLEEEYNNCYVLSENDPFHKKYGFNVKAEYSPELDDLLESKNIPYLINKTNIYFTVPDDIALYAIDNFISERKHMSKFTKISESRLNEKVLGFSNNIERQRLMKLAGLKEDYPEDDFVSSDTIDEPEVTDTITVPDGGIVEPVDVVPTTNSEAMNSIMDAFNSIQSLLPDVRLSEYKTLVIQSNELVNQIKSMGGNYLSEDRKKKG